MCLVNEYSKERREGQGGQASASRDWAAVRGGGSTLFGVTSEVKILAVAATSDSKFQLKVRRTFPLGLSKGAPTEKGSGELPSRR